jgi:hypothetical protein
MVVGCCRECGLTSLLVLISVLINRSGATLDEVGVSVNLDRHTVAHHLNVLVQSGFIKEGGTRSRRWRRVIGNDSIDAVSIDAAAFAAHANLGDGLALLLLSMALSGSERSLVVQLRALEELAGCSRNTLLKWLSQLKSQNLAEVTKVSSNLCRIVPSGALRAANGAAGYQKITEVRALGLRQHHLSHLAERARQLLAEKSRPIASVGDSESDHPTTCESAAPEPEQEPQEFQEIHIRTVVRNYQHGGKLFMLHTGAIFKCLDQEAITVLENSYESRQQVLVDISGDKIVHAELVPLL